MVGAWVHIFIYRLYPIINLCLLECWLEQVKFTKNSETKETELLCQILQVFSHASCAETSHGPLVV